METRNRKRKKATLAAALGFVIGLTGAASAADFCIDYTIAGFFAGRVVGKDFRVPGAGRCKPFYGFEATGATGTIVTGAACTRYNGSVVRFTLT